MNSGKGNKKFLISRRKRCLARGTAKGLKIIPFWAELFLDEERVLAIYKPRDGEAPLWDFPSGTLYKREYASSCIR
jgi:hypothetical protein